MIVDELINVFSMFMAEIRWSKCSLLNSFAFILFFPKVDLAWRNFRFISAKLNHSMLIGVDSDDK